MAKSGRPEFAWMMDAFRAGDTLVIDSFSRLSRSTKELLETMERLDALGVQLVGLKEQLDTTTTATGKLMLTMLSALSQFERDIIAGRTRDGLNAARSCGRMSGWLKAGDEKTRTRALKLYRANAMTNREIATVSGVSLSTLNRWIATDRSPRATDG